MVIYGNMSRKANKAFQTCRNRSVEFTPWDKQGVGGGLIRSGTRDPTDVNHHNRFWGFSAKLTCAGTEDQGIVIEAPRYDYPTQPHAREALKQVAAEYMCGGCIFANMDPAAISEQRTKEASADAERIIAFTLRQEAYDMLRKAYPGIE
jgi:hypothetical protein